MVKLLLGRSLFLVVRTRTREASSLQSSCCTTGWESPPAYGGAAAEADLCLLLSISIWDGKREGLHPAVLPSPLGWSFCLGQEEGAESRQGKCLIRGGENSAVALAKEQESPPFPLLCSCCRQGCPALSCFSHWAMAPSYIQITQMCCQGILS